MPRLAGVPALRDVVVEASGTSGAIVARADDASAALARVIGALGAAGVAFGAASVSGPTLDDVYLHHVGHSFGVEARPPCHRHHPKEKRHDHRDHRIRPDHPLRASWFTQTGQVFRRWIVGTWRQAWGPVMSLLQPVIWIVLFGQVFSSLGALPGFGDASYIEYLVPGVLMMTVLYSGAWAGTGFIDDMKSGVMDQLLTAPIARSAIISGQLLQQLVINAIQSVIVLGIGWLAGARYPGGVGGIVDRARRRDPARDDLLLRLVGRRADGAQPGGADRASRRSSCCRRRSCRPR